MNHSIGHADRSPADADSGLEVDHSKRDFLVKMAWLGGAALLGLRPEPGLAALGELELKIDQYIKKLRRTGIIGPDETTAWSVYDFTLRRKLVSINEDAALQSASMIKPFVAQAFFYRLAENRVDYHGRHRERMEAMICRSSNVSTNYFIDLLGGRHRPRSHRPREVERILKSNAPSIFRQTHIVERIPVTGATYRNKASAHDYSRFLYAVWNDRLPYAGEIRRLMCLPNTDRIKSGTSTIPPQTRVYDKTGTTARLCGDMGIVEAVGRNGRRYPYTFIGIIEKRSRARHYGHWKAIRGDVIREVSEIVYTDLRRLHNLI